jgi:hypothetical protein
VLKPALELGWADMIGMDSVEHWARNISGLRQSLFVLDACFSGLAGFQPKRLLRDKTIDRLAQYGHHLITAGTEDEQSIAVNGASSKISSFGSSFPQPTNEALVKS